MRIYEKWITILLYIIVGAVTTLINIVSFWIFTTPIRLDYRIANTIAWILSVLFAYVANKVIVFQSQTETKKEILTELSSFIGFRLLSYAMDLVAMIIMISGLHINETIAKVLTNVVVLVANYIFSKLFIFRKQKEKGVG